MTGGQSIAFAGPRGVARPSLVAGLLAFEALLVVLYIVTRSIAASRAGAFFNLDAEQSLGAWFSSSQFLVTGIVLWLAGDGVRAPEQPAPWFLRLSAAGFLFLSLDEAAAVHETLSRGIYKLAPAAAPFGHAHSAWLVLYGLAAPALVAVFWPQVSKFWRAFPAACRMGLVGAVVILAGAAGIESLGYVHLFSGYIEVALEETLEMIGATLMLLAALAVKDEVSAKA